MLMTTELSPLAVLILDTLKTERGWLTRQEIATAMGRPGRMQPLDIEKLEGMVDQGLIEKSEMTIGAVQTAFVYRARLV